MKKLGIIRRIDELGRIVIPKELRKSLRLKVGDYLEICTENEEIILKKYSELDSIHEFAKLIAETIYQSLKKDVIITDRDKIIACEGKYKKKLKNQKIGKNIVECIEKRIEILEKYSKNFEFTPNFSSICSYAISTLVISGVEAGTVIIFDENENIDDNDFKIVKIITSFLQKNLEQE